MTWGKKEDKVWHLWFAWRPVRVINGKIVWLKYVERKEIKTLCPENAPVRPPPQYFYRDLPTV
ncbi:MAG: hypothetical protein HY505_01350 [Candidatus Yanofskybacteria bacterium]|nr:hypothetical protein [Candidatus Yanofskybacteria bacterium]